MQKENLDFIDEAIHAGFCTHIYLESGFLHEKDAKFRLFRAQDERRDVFDLASLTKALVTAPLSYATWMDSISRKFEFDSNFFRRFSEPFFHIYSAVAVDDLLSHQSGLPAWLNVWLGLLQPQYSIKALYDDRVKTVEEVMARTQYIWSNRLNCERYSDMGYIILGLALEAAYGKNLSEIFSDFLKDLKFKSQINADFGFPADMSPNSQIYITSAYCPLRQRWLKGEVHDENCAALGGISGHAGLFGSGPKVSSFLKSLYASDVGHRFFEENEARRLATKGLLGLRPGDDQASQKFCNGMALGHWGFTGTGFWLHVPTGKYAIVLTNRVISGRVSNKTMPFRAKALSFLNETLL